jgi:hypothetical protein
MKNSVLFVGFLFGLFSCGQKSNSKKSQTTLTKNNFITKELWTLYSKQDSVIHVKRLVSSDTGLTLLSYEINTSEPEVAKQSFISSKSLSDINEGTIIKSQYSNFNWTPNKVTPILFVQMQYPAFKNEMEALDKCGEIELKLDKALKLIGLGHWIAGDIGPGGANMLFEVSNIDNAISTILELLAKEGLDNKSVIGRRINEDSENWFYEVVYPINFNGIFITI